MSTFTNISGGQLVVTDEIGLPVKFNANEQKANLSNYFKIYTSTVMGDEALLRLDTDDGSATPPPGNDGQNVAVLPGHPTTVAATGMGAHSFPGTSEHDKKVLFDSSNENQAAPATPGGYLRFIDTTHLGIKPTTDNPPDPTTVDEGFYLDTANDRMFVVFNGRVYAVSVTDVTP